MRNVSLFFIIIIIIILQQLCTILSYLNFIDMCLYSGRKKPALKKMQLCAKCVFEFSFARLILDVLVLLLRKYGLNIYTCPQYFHESYKKQRDKKKISIDSFIYFMEWHLCLKNMLSLKQAIVVT